MDVLTKDYKWYWIWMGVFLLGGAYLLMSIDTGDEVLFFSERRTAFGNVFFRVATHLGEFIAFVSVMGILLFFSLRRTLVVGLMGFAVLISGSLLKFVFHQPRPKSFFQSRDMIAQLNFVDGVYVNSGATSFPSGHTMGAFALFGLLALFFPRRPLLASLFFLTALSVGVSRIYLVQHFLKDVYLGAILGTMIALLAWSLDAHWSKKLWSNWRLPMLWNKNQA